MPARFERQSATAISGWVNRRETPAVEIARAALERVAAYEPVQPAVWIARVDPVEVLARAAAVDARIAAGERLALAGVPFAVKDNLDVAGLPTTAACPAFSYRPDTTAPVVQRLLDAGAILVGKTNLDQFATGLTGSRSPYGALGSPYNRVFISGGSSSGSAVAVAAGLVAFALGSDTAGSGRAPAALNGLVGLKPTRGRWSTRGLVPACRSLDCVSVLANTTADARLVDETAAGFDPEDPYARREPEVEDSAPETFAFALPPPAQLDWLGDSESPRLFHAVTERLRAMGGREVSVDIWVLLKAAELLYRGPWVAERTAAVEKILRQNPAAIHPVVRGILAGGLSISAVEAFRGEYALRVHQRAAEAIWAAADVLVLPTTATTYRVDEVLAEPLVLNANLGRYTNFVNLLDMSAIAVPAGFRENATGFGVTLIGPAWADRRLLSLAQRYEEIAPMPAFPPIETDSVAAEVKLAVVGAHLAGMPLHWQLESRGARLVSRCKTAAVYRLYAVAESVPPKPALAHVGAGGAAIEVEVYALRLEAFGSFVADVPPPLAIGTVTLEDGSAVKGFVAEPRALAGAEDITGFGGWRAFVSARSSPPRP
ncbi:MAG TPA: allophanate hydrolase [Caulobacteraceae bacterium]|nr:allophanate hydrolase [Caulobacteraceae bacterium]